MMKQEAPEKKNRNKDRTKLVIFTERATEHQEPEKRAAEHQEPEKFTYLPLDKELLKEASCALGNKSCESEDEPIDVVGLRSPQLHKRAMRGGVSSSGHNCYWIIEKRTPKRRDAMTRLEEAAESGDERAFVSTMREIDWHSKGAEEFAKAIKLAFRAGVPSAAEHLYGEGVKAYSDDPSLQQFARLFSPTSRATRTLPSNPTLKANREWLRLHRGEYSGQWIALRNGELLATASSLDELIRRVGDTTNVLLTRA